MKWCDNCRLLGHPSKYCATGPVEGTQATTPANGCEDCHAFNQCLPKHLYPTRSRPTDHAVGSKKYPTLEFYRHKLLPRKPAKAAASAAAPEVSPGTSAATTASIVIPRTIATTIALIEKTLAAVTFNPLVGMDL